MTPAQARRQRAQTMKEIARELKRADRARLLELRAQVRTLAGERARAIARARGVCKGRRVPTLREAAAILRAARADAKATCASELAAAERVKGAAARARAERDAERRHQATMRRLASQARDRKKDGRPGLARAAERRQESDDEVRANLPPELVALFDRVRRQIRGSDRMSRTEAFLQYAHEHPDEELRALEDKADRMIAEYERRANPARAARPSPFTARPYKPRAKEEIAKWRAALEGAAARAPKTSKASKRKARTTTTTSTTTTRRTTRINGAWWDAAATRARAGGRLRVPRASLGASWWAIAEARRAAIVERLARSKDARVRGAAVAQADAERKRHARSGASSPTLRKTNPREIVSLVYLEKKPGDAEPFEYEHEFTGERPKLEMRGGALQVRGGTYTTRRGWIEG